MDQVENGTVEVGSDVESFHVSVTKKMSAKMENYWDIKIVCPLGSQLDAVERIREVDMKMKELFGI